MSDPVGRASDLTVLLDQSSTSSDFAGSLPDTFAAWLNDLQLEPEEKIAPAQPPGEVRFEGTLRVDGYLVARLRSLTGTLFISESGEVESDIVVGAAIIDGVLHGDIHATERVELQSHARVFGNIESPALTIQPGAVFEGQCRFLSSTFKADPEEFEQPCVGATI